MNMKLKIWMLAGMLLLAGLTSVYGCKKKANPAPADNKGNEWVKTDVTFWLTNPDKSALLKRQNIALLFNPATNNFPTIIVDSAQRYQTMDGFGFAMTGGSAFLINKLPAAARNALVRELFANDTACIGLSYLRVSIGASDLDAAVFSYDDMPAGQTDNELTHFSLDKDRSDLIPLLKLALLQNPGIKIMGSPWSAPTWMKSNKSSIGGNLLPEYYDAYARYFVKYIQGMQAEGIRIDAITIQNEPLNPNNNPSMYMSSAEQLDFVKNNLGPAFKSANLTTKIILYDHNCDHPEYPINILNDAAARPFIDGSAFHLYGGEIDALSQVHAAYPEKNIYFTEQWVGGPGEFAGNLRWHVKNLIIGAPGNWSKNVIEWNLASDPTYSPHTPGGCTQCEGAVTISSAVTRNVSYYIMAHASKFVPAGSVRISSTLPSDLQNVAYQTPDGKKVLIVLNDKDQVQSFNIKFKGKMVTTKLNAGAVATFAW